MCCRACPGYEACQSRNELRDDCCPQCRYFEDCMEKDVDEDQPQRGAVPTRRPYRPPRR
jgi:hypothetical protein